MDLTLWENICARYGLAAAPQLPQPVSGGLKHHLYQARTVQGDYAVKVLNPRLVSEPNSLRHYRQSEQIAQAAAHAGLPAVTALPGPDGPVQAVGPATVMVFPWLSGLTLPPGPAPPEASRQIGRLLGKLHTLAPKVDGLEPPAVPYFPEAHWAELVRRAYNDGTPWARAVEDVLPELGAWSLAARQAQDALGVGWTATHRDMDQKNVLWSDPHMPWLLDWEEAGAMNPALEVMGTALNWAGQAAGLPSEAPFIAFLNGYRSAASLDGDALRYAAVAVLDKWLIWLELNLARSLRAAQAPPEEQATACGAAEHALVTLHALAAEAPRRLQWCDRLEKAA